MRFKLRRHKGTLGHMCRGHNVDVYDENGEHVGYLNPKFAERLPQIAPPTFPLANIWKVGDRVEYVDRNGGGGLSITYRRGTVTAIEPHYVTHERLIVSFEDGETRSINPDVMRHVREE